MAGAASNTISLTVHNNYFMKAKRLMDVDLMLRAE